MDQQHILTAAKQRIFNVLTSGIKCTGLQGVTSLTYAHEALRQVILLAVLASDGSG